MDLKAYQNSKELFSLNDEGVYFNTASFSPSFKSVETAGINAVKAKSQPQNRANSDLFEPVTEVKALFAEIIKAENSLRVVTIPSVSYGLATVANNIKLKEGDEIIILEEQFPSNVYVWKSLANKFRAKIITILQPEKEEDWNLDILNAISDRTALVAIPQIHWANGYVFDLNSIRKKTKAFDSLLIIDGSQSIGAMPFSIKEIDPDALICAGYKWLFGPFGCAYAYYGPYFDGGTPIEENWANRLGSENLSGLTQYQSEYKPLAQRYQVGQSGSFIYIQMQKAALREVLKINPMELQDYCCAISNKAIAELQKLGFTSIDAKYRAKHMFGLKIPKSIDKNKLSTYLKTSGFHLSIRGAYLRVSCHLFNNEQQFLSLVSSIRLFLA